MQIIANTNLSQLIDPDPEIESKVDQALAPMIPNVQFTPQYRRARGKWDGREHLYKKGIFPTGLLSKVLDVTGLIPVIDNRFDGIIDLRDEAVERMKTLELKGIKLYDWQREMCINGIRQCRGQYFLKPNSGKSEVIIAIHKAIGRKSIWLADQTDLLYQNIDRYKERTGEECGFLGDSQYKESDGMTVAMVQTMNKMPQEVLDEFLSQFTCIFIDEASHSKAKTWYKVGLSCPAQFRYSLTGTPPTDKYSKYKMFAITDPQVLGERTNQENIESGQSAKPTIHIKPLKYPKNSLPYAQAYNVMIRFNKKYASIVADEVELWYKQNKKVMLLVERISQGSNIIAELKGRNINAIYLKGPDDPEYRKEVLDEFREGKVDVLVGTKILATGIDLPAVNVLILAAGGKSAQQQGQRLGRGLRRKQFGDNKVDIVDFLHLGNYDLQKHSIERVDLYQREGFDCKWYPEVEL